MTDMARLRRISPADLAKTLAQVRDQQHRELVLLGPDIRLSESPLDWPDELKGRSVLQLTENVDGVVQKLLELLRFNKFPENQYFFIVTELGSVPVRLNPVL